MIQIDRWWFPSTVVSVLLLLFLIVTWDRRATHLSEPVPSRGVVAPPKTVRVEDLLAERAYLLADDWHHLDSALAFNHDSARRDVNYETHYRALMDAFDVGDPALRVHFDAWAKDEPSSATAHIARATYFNRLSWKARGGKFADETSQRQFEGMQDWNALAHRELLVAKSLDADNVLVYWLELGLAFGDDGVDPEAVLKEGLAHAPGSLLLPVRRVLQLTPRWGGSVEAMEQYGAQATLAVARNPRLRIIPGFVNYDAARGHREEKRNQAAIAELTTALGYGEHFEFRNDLGWLHYYEDNLDAALDDLNRALAERPGSIDALAMRSAVLRGLAEMAHGARRVEFLARANSDVKSAFTLDSTAADAKWAVRHRARVDSAMAAP